MKKIVKIEPYYEPRMWGGGRRLIDEFHYVTDVKPLGEVYNVVALPGHADCFVPEMDRTLSELYVSCPEWFECETKELPIRVNILDPMADLSIQIHPDDTFARSYNGGRGKPEAWVILDAPQGWLYRVWPPRQNPKAIHGVERKRKMGCAASLLAYAGGWVYRHSGRDVARHWQRRFDVQHFPQRGLHAAIVRL